MKRLPALAGFVLASLAAGAPVTAAVGDEGAGRAGGPAWDVPGWPSAARDGRPAPARTFQSGMSLDEAVDLVQRRYGGRVVRAETRQDGRETVHRIRLLSDDGRVITVSVNARTGRID